jgi:hypothetical protein
MNGSVQGPALELDTILSDQNTVVPDGEGPAELDYIDPSWLFVDRGTLSGQIGP